MFPQDAYNTLKRLFPSCRKSGSDFVAVPCPTCEPKDRKKNKRCVNGKSLRSNCFICQTMLDWDQLTGGAAMPDMRNRVFAPPEPEKPPHEYAKKMPCTGEPVPINQLPPDHPAVRFLNKDFIYDMDLLYNAYGVVYVPQNQGLVLPCPTLVTSADRIVFPVIQRGEMVGWQMRSTPGTTLGDRPGCLKYYHLFEKGSYLYNYDNAKNYSLVVVTEGVKKAWKFPCGVATWGKGISDTQLQLIQEWNNIMIMLDGEDVTQQKANELATQLIYGGYCVVNVDPRKYGFPSPDEMTAEQAQHIMMTEWTDAYGPLT